MEERHNRDDIVVSVICNTYNHENYIEQCIKGFLLQETNFKFEVLIHDDASTDKTAEVIRKYEKQYPDIIKPIYEEVNQYSLHVGITANIMLPKAKGKYFALCEGDDYWIDPQKLQKQVDYMESHPDCTFCIHNAIRVNPEGKEVGRIATVQNSRELSCHELIVNSGDYCATNSIMAPMALTKNLPEFYSKFFLDYITQIYFSSKGKSYCFEEYMSAYRVNTPGSWTLRTKSNDARVKHQQRVINALTQFNEYTEFAHSKSVEQAIAERRLDCAAMTGDKKILKDEEYKPYIKKLGFGKRLKLYARMYFPKIFDFLKRTKKHLKYK